MSASVLSSARKKSPATKNLLGRQSSAVCTSENRSVNTGGRLVVSGDELPGLNDPQALQTAFKVFNQVSSQLADSFHALEDRVVELTDEVEQANQRRLEEICAKEQIASRLEHLLQLLPGGVVVLDKTGRVSECNPAATELLGAELAGKYWRDIIRSSFAPRKDDGHEISLKNGRRISLATRSLDGDSGQIILLTDQTETRHLQQRVSRNQRLSAMGKMVSSLAHQIRTPLSAAILYAGHLGKENLTPEQSSRFTQKLMSRLYHMERQVKDMLIFAKGDAILDECISIDQLLAEMKTAAEVLLKQNTSSCSWENLTPGASIQCNKESLVGALLNLVENSLQSAGKKANLKIRSEFIVEPGSTTKNSPPKKLCLYIEDSGPGFEEELADQLTEPFFTTKPRGTGLGLAVAQVVAKAHNGSFTIEARKGGGVKAGFILPVVIA